MAVVWVDTLRPQGLSDTSRGGAGAFGGDTGSAAAGDPFRGDERNQSVDLRRLALGAGHGLGAAADQFFKYVAAVVTLVFVNRHYFSPSVSEIDRTAPVTAPTAVVSQGLHIRAHVEPN